MSSKAQLSAKRRWVSSEQIAHSVLEELGFRVVETRKKIVLSGVEVGEVDVVAEDPATGTLYAVEVKAGRLDVSGIRQAYVNALLIGATPMVICKGFADDAARELAEKLGVKVIQLSDIFLVESEELYLVIKEAVEEVLADYFELFYGHEVTLKPEHVAILEAVRKYSTIEEAAEKLGLSVHDFAKRLDDLRKQGVIPKWASKYSTIKRVAQVLLQKQSLASALEESRKLVENVKALSEQLKVLQSELRALSTAVSKIASAALKAGVQLQAGAQEEAKA